MTTHSPTNTTNVEATAGENASGNGQARTLDPKHREEMHASGIPDAMIDAARIYSTENEGIEAVLDWTPKIVPAGNPRALTGFCWSRGFVIPFFDIDGNPTGYCRVKLDNPRVKSDGDIIKYESPVGKPNLIYIPPGFKTLAATHSHVLIVEGEKKALCAQSHGIPTIGLVGVYGWCRPRRKDKDGNPIGKKTLIPELAALIKRGMELKIAFDTDC